MRKGILIVSVFLIFIGACKKKSDDTCSYTESTTVAPVSETNTLDAYFAANGITAIKLPSGVYYTLDSTGTGVKPAGLCANLTVTYKGLILGSTSGFDSTTSATGVVLQLGGLVVGWQKALREINMGSKFTLYIPPSLGYGGVDKKNGDGDVIIPANSFLKFVIQLIKVQ